MSNGILYDRPSGKCRLSPPFSLPTARPLPWHSSREHVDFQHGRVSAVDTTLGGVARGVSVTRATSRRLMTELLLSARITISSNSATDDRRPRAIIGLVEVDATHRSLAERAGPPTRGSGLSARCISCTVVRPRSASLSELHENLHGVVASAHVRMLPARRVPTGRHVQG